MRIPRIHVPGPIDSGLSLQLPDQAARHVNQVLRLKESSALIVFDGEGGEFEAVITAIQKRSVTVKIGAVRNQNVESPLKIHLIQGISRGERMDIALQKAVELGVNTITPVFTERCNVKLSGDRLHKKHQHWYGVLVSACEQSGRSHIPMLNPAQKLSDVLSKTSESLRLVLDPNAERRLPEVSNNKPEQLELIIGPEGGLSDNEIRECVEAGCEAVTLGPRILRTETAAIAVLAITQTLWGDI